MTTQRPEDVYDYMPAEPGYSPVVRAFKVSDFEDPVQIGKGKYVDHTTRRVCVHAHALSATLLLHRASCTQHRDSIIYAATCYKLGGKVVALKVYERSKLSSSKMRAIRREISIMNYVTQKKYGLWGGWVLVGGVGSFSRGGDDGGMGGACSPPCCATQSVVYPRYCATHCLTADHTHYAGFHGPFNFMVSCVRMTTFVW